MDEIVETARVSLHRPLDLLLELVARFLLRDPQIQPVDQELHVLILFELGHARREHDQEHVNQLMPILTQYVVGLAAFLLKVAERARLHRVVHDVRIILRGHVLLELLVLVGVVAHAAFFPRGPMPPLRGLVIVSPLGVEDTHVVTLLIGERHLIRQLQLLRVLSQWTAIHEECDLLGEYERVSLTLDPELLLHVSEEVPEIDVQEVSFLEINHDVIRVTISQAKDVACHTVASR
jgi:hypothetical protein